MPSFRPYLFVATFGLFPACGDPASEDQDPPASSSSNVTSSGANSSVSTSTGTTSSVATSTGETSSAPTISYAADIEPIFTTNCSFCHSEGNIGVGAPDSDLNLSAGKGYAALTTQSSVVTGTPFIGPTLAESYLWAKLEGTEPPAGTTMPFGTVLLGTQLTLIKQWIEGGALP